MRKILPLILILLGTGAGVGGGLLLRPAAEAESTDAAAAAPPASADPAPETLEYVKLPSQFVIPVIDAGRVGSLVVLSLSIEAPMGASDAVFQHEPKLRDEFLRVLFDHANVGGFRGTFTDGSNLVAVRRALLEAARKVLGPENAFDVLITDIVRQDS